MTTIAWDGKVLAGDRKCVWGDEAVRTRKVFKLRLQHGENCPESWLTRLLIGFSGRSEDKVSVLYWLKHPGTKPQPHDSFWMIAIDCRGRLWSLQEKLIWVRIKANKWAIGTGGDYAMGAMASGKSAVEAVRIAIKLDNSSGFGVDTVRF